jgi:hypothetical protein
VVLTTCAAGLISIGKLVLPAVPPTHASSKEDRKKIMKERVSRIVRIPYPLLTDLAINCVWFVMRVNKAQREGDLGNG